MKNITIDPKQLPTRAEQFCTLDQVDVLIIGGGATGAGVALDAISRGLSVLLVEKNDFGSQTSSRSTKLVHGGVRYLEKAVRDKDPKQYHLVRESLHERGTLMHIAPYAVHPIKIITPIYKTRQIPYIWTGLKVYDLISGKGRIARSQFVSSDFVKKTFSHINPDNLKGGVIYHDAQFNDTRLNITLILSAMNLGASALNYTEAVRLIKEEGKIVGVEIHDRIGGGNYCVKSGVVINATGPFADTIRWMDDPTTHAMMCPSAGTHILLDKKYTAKDTGILIPRTADGRVIFMLPWEGGTIAGTTDHASILTETPHCTEEELTYLLETISTYFDQPITKNDVKAVWTGLRPLVQDSIVTNTSKLCRDHLVLVSSSGLVSIMGGKWTTYRKMAEDTINIACPNTKNCITDHLLLLGAKGYTENTSSDLAKTTRLPPDICDHLVNAYGMLAFEVVKVGSCERLVENYPIIEAEVIWAMKHEYAETIVDVLARRTRLAFLDAKEARRAVERVAQLMGKQEQVPVALEELRLMHLVL